jgi:REP-associated tyrosine transposase
MKDRQRLLQSEEIRTEIYAYIGGQAEHLRKITFQDELRQLLKRHRVVFDERYLWD